LPHTEQKTDQKKHNIKPGTKSNYGLETPKDGVNVQEKSEITLEELLNDTSSH